MTVVVTTDGSERSHSVLPHAARLAAAAQAPLVLLRALDPRVDCKSELVPSLQEAIALVTERWLTEMRALLATRGVEGRAEVAIRVHGDELHETLLGAAANLGATVIATTTRGSGALRQAVLGSTAMGVLGKAGVPILLGGPALQPPSEGPGYRVFFTSDGSPSAEAALAFIVPVVAAANAHVTLWQAAVPVTGIPGGPTAEGEARARLAVAAAGLPAGVSHEVEVEAAKSQSDVPDAVIARAVATGSTAIAMSTHGHSARYQLLAGSVTMEVIRKSPLPLLVAPRAGSGKKS